MNGFVRKVRGREQQLIGSFLIRVVPGELIRK